jgi:hypothetical protein
VEVVPGADLIVKVIHSVLLLIGAPRSRDGPRDRGRSVFARA